MLRACMCSRKNGMVLKLDTNWTLLGGELHKSDSYSEWPSNVLTLTLKGGYLEIGVRGFTFQTTCSNENVEGLAALATATHVPFQS